jgi:hypothetical protein
MATKGRGAMEAVIPATAMALRISEEGERRATRYPVEQTSSRTRQTALPSD